MSLSQQCLQQTPDCGSEDLNLNGICYNFSNNPKNCDTYTQQFQDYLSTQYISNQDNVSLLNCIGLCHTNNQCEAVKFSYNDSQANEMDVIGNCKLLNSKNTINLLPQPITGYSCCDNFDRQDVDTSTSCVNILGQNSSVSIDLTSGKIAPMNEKIITKYQGVDCRKQVSNTNLDPNQNSDLLTAMGGWCNNNRDIDVCKNFCENELYKNFCDSSSLNKIPIITAVIFFSLLFIIIMLYLKVENPKIKFYAVIILSIIMITLTIYGSVKYIEESKNNGFPGGKPDYTRTNWTWNNSGCQIQQFYKCTWTNPSCCGNNGVTSGTDSCGGMGQAGTPGCGMWATYGRNYNDIIDKSLVQKNTVLTGVTLWASYNGYILTAIGNPTYALIGQNPLGSSQSNVQYGLLDSSTDCTNPMYHECNIYAGNNYALCAIEAGFFSCKMGSLKFTFADVYNPENPLQYIIWPTSDGSCGPTTTEPQVQNTNSDCSPLTINPTIAKCQPTQNVRWFIQNFNIETSNATDDGYGHHLGCYYYGLNRFMSVDFIGINIA
jgi:hypothetical protein